MDDYRWWQQRVIYQLVVPSFLDTNGDGTGDLNGVTERLDYLQWLGVGVIWLSPIYPSPMADLGYDVSDYRNINPQFGSLEDFDRLLTEAHARDLKVILDWVPNHTSDEHAWFQESRSSRENPKRDWYIWRDAKPDGSPPNNWISVFGGSVWQWDEHTQQFYLHTFLDKQPDLNWRNPEVHAEVHDAMRFWLARGVDGFRVDAACLMLKDEQFRDNPPNPGYNPETDGPDSELLAEHTRNQPGLHQRIGDMRRVLDEFDDRLLTGELYLPVDMLVQFYGDEQPELHLPLNMQTAWTQWEAESLGKMIELYVNLVPPLGWPSWMFSTHDCPRMAARAVGEQTRIAAMLLMTLRGTPTLYYGEEIGMRGVPIPADQARDPQGRRTGRNRDPERTPMQWDGSPNAGFTSGSPWLPVGDDREAANVAAQSEASGSLLALYRRLMELRRQEPTLITGHLEVLSHENPLLAFSRSVPDHTLTVILNTSGDPQAYDLGDLPASRILLSSFLDRENEAIDGTVHLRGDEGVILAS